MCRQVNAMSPNPLSPSPLPNDFDPYREALIVEAVTLWPDEYDGWSPADRQRVEALLHGQPQQAAQLEYLRQHTGFCRQITVTPADLERLAVV